MQGNDSVYVGKKYGFADTYDRADAVFNDDRINTVFVVTRHNTHAELILKGIKAGKHVFTEKPLAMNEAELEDIRKAYESSNGQHLMVGFNRRFSPAVQYVKKTFLEQHPKNILIRVNAGVLPPDHWVNDPEIGGGRIVGEACHFIDLAMYIAGSKTTSVYASTMDDPNKLGNSIHVNLEFENGSVASVGYFSNGSKKLSKEYIEVFCGGTVAIIEDFNKMSIHGTTNKKVRLKGQDKGHASEIKLFFESIRNGKPCPIPFEESYLSTLATFKAIESAQVRRTIML
jgi:predicted dehydrogenase